MHAIRRMFGKDIVERVAVGAGVLIAGLLVLVPYLFSQPLWRQLALLIPVALMLLLVWMAAKELAVMVAAGGWKWRAYVMAGIVVIGLGFAVVLAFQSWQLYLVLLLGTFGTDSFALLGGRIAKSLPGYRTHAMTSHSASKTVEGLVTGLVLGWATICVTAAILASSAGLALPWYGYVLVGFVPPVAVYGDFFESRLKRDYEMKDSGSCLGPHGGILDRLDSVSWVFGLIGFALLLAQQFSS